MATSKTFIPALVRLAHRICRYIAKHADTIDANLDTQAQKDALTALNAACTAFCIIVTEPAEQP